MSDAKRDPRTTQGAASTPEPTQQVTSFIREHATDPINLPAPPLTPDVDVDRFLDDWALHHFTTSVKLHDAERVTEAQGEGIAVLEDVGVVQGVLLELHEYATHDARVRGLMTVSHVVQNGIGALYRWLDEVLDAAAARGIARRRPSFVDGGEDAALVTILGALERVHPDLEELMHLDSVDRDVARKLGLCFRQIGAAIVRVSGRASSSMPPASR